MRLADKAPPPANSGRSSLVRIGLRIVFIVTIVFVVHQMSGWLMGQAQQTQALPMAGIGLILVVFTLLIAVPFVPGIEIALALMVMQGSSITPFIYGATVLGLMIAYTVGAIVPDASLQRVFADFRLKPATHMMRQIAPLSADQRLTLLQTKLPEWLGPVAVRYRYIALAIIINTPGNSLLGGGGGLSLMAGLSRLFRFWPTLITYMIAVAPIPVLVWFFGSPVAWFTG